MYNWNNYVRYDSSDTKVKKFVFTKDDAVCETVLYAYPTYKDRTVICCSVMSGCPVGCRFCGTGNKFVRNLTSDEIVEQITAVLENVDIDHRSIGRFQIMFMSMGEPFLNGFQVHKAIRDLNDYYPDAELLVSTVGINGNDAWSFNDFTNTSMRIDKIGLQFSIHKSTDEQRNKLIPYRNKMTLKEIRDAGTFWSMNTQRPVYLNYCVDGTNNRKEDFERLSTLFSPVIFNFTFSVICSSKETMKDAGFNNLSAITKFEKHFLEAHYNTRLFNPAGQDDIGGGCGQLWYVQEWMKKQKQLVLA